MELIREILASHESGISRDGLLAWARLRGDPGMTDEQLDAALAGLGDEVVDVQGFLYLRQHAPASALAGRGAGGEPAGWGTPAAPPESAPPGWVAPDAAAGASPAWPPPPVQPAGEPAGWAAPGGQGWVPPDGQGWSPPDGQGWSPPDGQAWPPPESSGSRRTMVVAAVAVFLFVAMAGVAALLMGADDDGGDTTAVPTPTSGTVIDALTLEVGNCVVLPSEDQFEEIRTLACTDPHDGEIFLVQDHPGSEFPSNEEFSAWAEAQCLPAFAAYTGSAYDDQEVLDVGWFTPTEGSWGNGDREVACYLTPLAGTTSQSWRNANP